MTFFSEFFFFLFIADKISMQMKILLSQGYPRSSALVEVEAIILALFKRKA